MVMKRILNKLKTEFIRQRVRIIKRTSRGEFKGKRRALKFFRFSSRWVMIRQEQLNRTLYQTLPHMILCFKNYVNICGQRLNYGFVQTIHVCCV
ncbi:hypothetical protein HanRHA438_Chr06g0251591 [Helianthus annuus]|nr:hypothetical protein HanRHA438_Chr06g0251591 [Helianthus annuus]